MATFLQARKAGFSGTFNDWVAAGRPSGGSGGTTDRTQQIGTSSTSDGRSFLLPQDSGTSVTQQQPASQTTTTQQFQTRQAPTVATPEQPAVSLSSGQDDGFDALSDRDKQIQILLKQSKGENLTDAERTFRISQFLDQQTVTRDDIAPGIGDTLAGQLSDAETRLGRTENELKTDRDKAIEQKRRELDALVAGREDELRAAGRREQDAAGTRLSFSGFGRSTFAADQAGQIQKRVEDQVTAARRAADVELELFRRRLEGADEETLSGLRNEVSGIRNQIREFELESAMQVAELNRQNELAFEESFSNLLQTLEPQGVSQKSIDKSVSELLGYASDEFGNPIFTDDSGNPVPLPKENDVEWGSTTDMFGNTIFYDKSNPANQISPGQNVAFTNQRGAPASSPTSTVDGVQSFGEGEVYTRDDGSQGTLGENCVKWAREQVPSLPFGLFNKQDKINAINFAEEQGFGSRNMQLAQVGDAILTGEGNVGHAAVIQDIDPQTGELILAEANYTPGQVTAGRRISMNDPKIYGFVSANLPGAQSSVVNEGATNEGYNPAIAAQVVASTTEERREFGAEQETAFRNWEKNFDPKKLPAQFKNPAAFAQFQTDYAAWNANKSPIEKLTQNELTLANSNANKFDSQPVVKNFVEVQNKAASINRIIDSGVGGPGDLALVFEFMKALDPTSVVRESEFESAAKSGNFFKGAFAQFNGKFTEGSFLTPEVRESFRTLAGEKFNVIQQQYDNTYDEFAKRINNVAGSDVAPLLLTDHRIEGLFDSPQGVQQSGLTTTRAEVQQAAQEFGMSFDEYANLLRQNGYNIQ